MKLLIQGEKLCFDISGRKRIFFKKICSVGFKWLFEASCVKEDIVWFRVFDSTSENKQRNRITVEKMIPHRFVQEASCVIRRCDNHYSLALIGLLSYKDSESNVNWHVLGVCIIPTLIAIEKVVLSRSEVLLFGSLELREYFLKVSLQSRE